MNSSMAAMPFAFFTGSYGHTRERVVRASRKWRETEASTGVCVCVWGGGGGGGGGGGERRRGRRDSEAAAIAAWTRGQRGGGDPVALRSLAYRLINADLVQEHAAFWG